MELRRFFQAVHIVCDLEAVVGQVCRKHTAGHHHTAGQWDVAHHCGGLLAVVVVLLLLWRLSGQQQGGVAAPAGSQGVAMSSAGVAGTF